MKGALVVTEATFTEKWPLYSNVCMHGMMHVVKILLQLVAVV